MMRKTNEMTNKTVQQRGKRTRPAALATRLTKYKDLVIGPYSGVLPARDPSLISELVPALN
jgi:hypothetical protein